MKRLKKILKWTGIALGMLVAILLVANAVFVWTTDARLERQLAALRAAGDPITLADLAPKPIPPEKNAATYLRRAEADVEAICNELDSVHSVSVWPLPPMSQADQNTITAAFDAYPNVISLLEQAAGCPDYDARLDYTVSPYEFNMQLIGVAQKIRRVAWVLKARALSLVNEGNRDGAVRTALILFRLSRHFDRDPSFVNFYMTMNTRHMAAESAGRALRAGPISKELRGDLDAELALQDDMERYVWTLKSGRALQLDFFGLKPYRNVWLINRGLWNLRESEYLDEMQAFLALLREPITYRQVMASYSHPDFQLWWESRDVDEISDIVKRRPFLSIPRTFDCVARTQAEVRALRVLNALQAHVPAGSNDVPKLTELGLSAETTADPFTGEPLHIKKTPQGWLVYSVGPNFQDDGGKLDDPATGDIGVGPPPPPAKPVKK